MGDFPFLDGNFMQSWETFPATASPSLPDHPGHSANSFNRGYLQGRTASLLPTQPGPNEPPYLLQGEQGGVSEAPRSSAVPGLGCCAAEGSGKDWAPAKDVSALTRSGDSDDRGWGRRESHAQAGKEGRQGDDGEEGWGGIGSPSPSCPLCIAKASPGLEKAGFVRVFSVSSKAPLKLGEREGGVGLYV